MATWSAACFFPPPSTGDSPQVVSGPAMHQVRSAAQHVAFDLMEGAPRRSSGGETLSRSPSALLPFLFGEKNSWNRRNTYIPWRKTSFWGEKPISPYLDPLCGKPLQIPGKTAELVPVVPFLTRFFFGREGSPTKMDHRKKGDTE